MQETNDDKANRQDIHKSFWGAEFDGEPVWYIATMIAVGIYLGILAETLRAGESAVMWALIAVIVSIGLLHVVTRRRGR